MKTCNSCHEEKPLGEFNFRHKLDGIRFNYCKKCQNAVNARYYKANKDRHINNNRRHRVRNQKFLVEYLGSHPCVDCGEKDIVVLDFDHRGKKFKHVGRMANEGYSIKALLVEIAKCEVRCANCHRRLTAKHFGSYRI